MRLSPAPNAVSTRKAAHRSLRVPGSAIRTVALASHCAHSYTPLTMQLGGRIANRIVPGNQNDRAPTRRCATTEGQQMTRGSVAEGYVRVHYERKDRKHMGYGLHVWGAAAKPTEWMTPMKPSGYDDNGAWFDVRVNADGSRLGVLAYKGELKGAEAEVDVTPSMREVWMVGDEHTVFTERPNPDALPTGSITKQASVWANSDTIVWRHAASDVDGNANTFKLHYSSTASLKITGKGVEGAEEVFDLTPVAGKTPNTIVNRFPHLYGCLALKLPAEALKQATKLLKGQLLVSMASSAGQTVDATGVQLQGALDDLTAYEGPLGYHTHSDGKKATISVWAPTATSVQLLQWGSASGVAAEEVAMVEGALGPGVWSFELPGESAEWMWTYYKFRVTVYCPWTHKIEVCEVADPNSRSLTADGDRTQIVDLQHPTTYPAGWLEDQSPPIAQWTDIALYELHVRDFSITDDSVPQHLRGKYLAFSPEHTKGGSIATSATTFIPNTDGQRHLASLRAAGLNHIHLLPTYDSGSVPEREKDQLKIGTSLSGLPPDSEAQQAAVMAIADQDGFNWGYDPVHWGVPEGSYATDPDGVPRIVEFRSMVKALHEQDWRVVLDVVYNHVYSAGPHNNTSVLDKIVPGYYLRRQEDGEVCQSTCCNNTATEHFMCERLAIEDIVHWAKNYKVDGFRFDIMGHLMVTTLVKMRAGLDALTLEADGVDGKAIYIYGEAWDFGEVAGNQRGRNCGQMNMAGTRLGAFNDRLRDGALGGGPFAPSYHQGLVTGLALAPNGYDQGDTSHQLDELLYLTDMVRYSIAGNLRQYVLQCKDGEARAGVQSQMHGLPLAYGAHPEENVAFIGCHDNMTLFDQITEKAALTVLAEDRARMCSVSLSLIALSQGVPFFHAGDELLRSKSLDRDSYNSGDHFNRMDWTGQDNNFGVGLPPATKNKSSWSFKAPLLANPLIKPTPTHIRSTDQLFKLFLKIRYSSPLFRMPSADHIFRQLAFHNTGVDQTPGLVVMSLSSADVEAQLQPVGMPVPEEGGGTVDPNFKRIIVLFNCSPLEQQVPYPPHFTHLEPHPAQAAFDGIDAPRLHAACSAEDNIMRLTVAPRTTAVYVEPR